MNLKNIVQYMRKHEHPHYVNNQLPSETKVYCQDCEWTGTVAESLVKDPQNDMCPQCGNTILSYEI